MAAVRAWAVDLASTNNFQLCLQSCVLLMGQPVAAALVPALVCCAYQVPAPTRLIVIAPRAFRQSWTLRWLPGGSIGKASQATP